MQSNTTISVGRRKTSVARAYLKPGSGKFIVNKKEGQKYFNIGSSFEEVLMPLKITNALGTIDVNINVAGGGFNGQIGAVQLAISRALVSINEENKPLLRQNGFLTRDPRMVERKKYGRPKARKRFQFSKR
jgi:small subunit ribosomal protein S9